MNISYNLGDASGKGLSSLNFYDEKMMYILNSSRLVFFFTFLMSSRSANAFFLNDYFALCNIFFFGLSNGLATSGLM